MNSENVMIQDHPPVKMVSTCLPIIVPSSLNHFKLVLSLKCTLTSILFNGRMNLNNEKLKSSPGSTIILINSCLAAKT